MILIKLFALQAIEKVIYFKNSIDTVKEVVGSGLAAAHDGELAIGTNDSAGSFSFIYYILAFLLGALVMYFVGRLRSPSKKEEKLQVHGLHQKANNSPHEIAKLNSEIYRLKQQLADCESKRKEADRIQMEAVPQEEVRTAEWDISKDLSKATPVPIRFESILYFPNPNVEGNFRQVDSKENYTEGASIYKFSLSSPTEATYEFCLDKSAIGMAFNNRNELIRSVAKEINSYTAEVSAIQCVSKGKAILEGSTWRVVEKAEIKYI